MHCNVVLSTLAIVHFVSIKLSVSFLQMYCLYVHRVTCKIHIVNGQLCNVVQVFLNVFIFDIGK